MCACDQHWTCCHKHREQKKKPWRILARTSPRGGNYRACLDFERFSVNLYSSLWSFCIVSSRFLNSLWYFIFCARASMYLFLCFVFCVRVSTFFFVFVCNCWWKSLPPREPRSFSRPARKGNTCVWGGIGQTTRLRPVTGGCA